VLPRYARAAFGRPEEILVVEGTPGVVDMLWLIHRSEWSLPARAACVVEELRARSGNLA